MIAYSEWAYLLIAILAGSIGTVSMKLSQGLRKPLPFCSMVICYTACFIGLTLALKKIDLSIVYALWSGAGTVLVVIIGVVIFREVLSLRKAFSLLIIVIGVIGMHLTYGLG